MSRLYRQFGNAQIVIGVSLTDALSGGLRSGRAGDTGEWHAISAVGDLPSRPAARLPTT
jgi:hypothetical protein